jgi:hypothetical protein
MPPSEEKPILKYDSIAVSSRGIAETHGKKIVLFVPATEIQRITLRHGKSAHRPGLSIAIGSVMALAGIFGLIEFFIAMKGYRYELGLVAFGIIGASMIFDTFKQRYFLEVDQRKGPCRLIFSKNAQKGEIDDLCNKIKTTYPYPIADETRTMG